MTVIGRPRAFDADAVLDEVLELFWRNGYVSTSTRDLEEALGLSQSSLYNTFGSKAALLGQALDRYEARIDAELVVPLEQSPAGLGAIDDFLAALARWITSDGKRGCMVINLMAEDGGGDPTITRRTRRYRRRVRAALRDGLQRAAALDEIDADALDERADLLFGMVLGVNIAARGGAATTEITALMAGARHQLAEWQADAKPS